MATTFSDSNAALSCLNSLCSFDADDHFLNDLLQLKTESPTHNCSICNTGILATSRCRDCNKYLCDNCAGAHLRLPMTKDHFVMRISGSPVVLSPFLSLDHSPIGTYCEQHAVEEIKYFCDSCGIVICGECTTSLHRGHAFLYLQEAIEKARSASMKLLSDFRMGSQAVKEGLEMTQKMLDSVNMKSNTVIRDIHLVASKLVAAVNERESELRKKVESVRKIKNQVLIKQSEGLKNALAHFASTTEKLSEALEVGNPLNLLQVKAQATQDLKSLTRSVKVGLNPQEDDHITFVIPEFSTLFRAVTFFGDINAASFCQYNLGEGLLLNTQSRMLSAKTSNEDLSGSFDTLTNFVSSLENGLLTDTDDRRFMGHLPYRFNIDTSSSLPLTNSQIIQNKPANSHLFPVCVYSNKKYNNSYKVALTFGKEGDGDGELCRPWGVCCDLEGNIIVADRSNHRIQIFKNDGKFLRKFGKHGSEPGQFDRPAGVATNPSGHIVVADKDNHRIQIFTHDGLFLFTFGDKGSKSGQFNYPWDVDVNSTGYIVVSDTRNHRIQLFAGDGSFIGKYGFEDTSGMWKHFDSPRGVCFAPNSSIIVTDFNNHRLIVIEENCVRARFLGTEGSGNKQFLRPQGIAVDYDGHLIVADSRNNRIQVFENSGSFLWQFGSAGKDRGQLDRPSGVCVSPDGKIVVVDFGNNRIQIFE